MTEKQQYILGLVMDETVLRRIAWHKWTSRETIPDEIFLYLAESWVVHSELGLDHDLSMSNEALERALREGEIPLEKGDDAYSVSLKHICFRVHVESGGATVFTVPFGSISISLSAVSIVRLLQFVDEVLPDAKHMVMNRALRIEREELATTFASKMLRTKLDDLGVLYYVLECCDHLKVEILLPPSGKLRFSFKADAVDKLVENLDKTVSAAQTLYELHGIDADFCPLERWDRWAEPFNRND